MHQALLTGEPLPSEERAPAALDRKAYFHTPTFNSNYYHIRTTSADPPHLPTEFAGIQAKQHTLRLKKRNIQNPSLDIPPKMVKELATQMRRSMRAASYQEWFLGTTRTLLDQLAAHPENVATLTPQIQGVLLSGIRAASDGQAIMEYLHHNFTLLRRDAFLETIDPLLPADYVTTLRRHDLDDDNNLFGPADITAAQEKLEKLKHERTVQQALRHSPKAASPRTPPQRNYQNRSPRNSPRSGGNNNNNNNFHGNRNKWSPKGRGKPKSPGQRDGNNGK